MPLSCDFGWQSPTAPPKIPVREFDMNRTADFRIPGVNFLPHRPAQRLPLPPLDTAAFVGFTERGPLNLPVRLEDFNAFQQVYGGDLPVAQEVGGRVIFANLAGAVRSFFTNGGKSCYVVRVAGAKASAARLRIPGLAALGAGSGPRLGSVAASSPGGWGFQLRLGTRLSVIPLSTAGLAWDEASGILPALQATQAGLSLPGLPSLQAGDVLRLNMVDGSTWLGIISRLDAGAAATVILQFSRFYRLQDLLPASPLQVVESAEALTLTGPTDLLSAGAVAYDASGRPYMALDPADVSRLSAGDILRLVFAGSPPGDPGVLARIREIQVVAQQAGSPPSPVRGAFLSEVLILGPEGAAPAGLNSPLNSGALASPPFSPVEPSSNLAGIQGIQLLRFDMMVQAGSLRLPAISGLSFCAPHPHFWGDAVLLESSQVKDASLRQALKQNPLGGNSASIASPFADSANWLRSLVEDVYDLAPLSEASRQLQDNPPPSFNPQAALAGLLAPVGSLLDLTWEDAQAMPDDRQVAKDRLLTFLPVDMPEVFSEGDPAQFRAPESGRPGEDDLATFDPAVFYDPRLAPPSGGCGSGLGVSQRTLMETAFDLHEIQRIRLRGLHSLLFIDAVALLSVPDSAHLAWKPTDPLPEPNPPMPARPAPEPACPPEADFMACDQPPALDSVTPYFGQQAAATLVTLHGQGFTNTAQTQVFFDRRPAADVLVISSNQLTCSAPPGFKPGPVEVKVENENGAGTLQDGFIYISQSTGPDLPVIPGDAQTDPALINSLLCVHQAMQIFCQGRSDVVAIFSLPQHYLLQECLDWQQALRQRLGLPPLGQGFATDEAQEIADLSYAAVYHPWLLVADPGSSNGVRPEPPDGAVCGMIAASELARQAWVAPGNLPLQGLLGLDQNYRDDTWAEFFARRTNLVRPEATTFRVMSAHTLSGERSLMQISVRRLLIQLRKAAILLGMDYVFESNNELFREGVRVTVEELLRFMFERGAFAGRSEAESFRVITDDSVNTPQSIDEGKFVAMIQVAPSQPMEFISVQLTRTGDGGLITAEG